MLHKYMNKNILRILFFLKNKFLAAFYQRRILYSHAISAIIPSKILQSCNRCTHPCQNLKVM